VRNLRSHFHTRAGVFRAVDGVDLTVRAGRTLCLVGESGSGKSVTGLSILRLLDRAGRIEEGSEIVFEGRDLIRLGEREMRSIRGRDISMIFQEPSTSMDALYPVGRQIAEVIRTHEKVSAREADDRAVELMRMVGIPSAERRAREYPHQMSGGMLQRVMIASALSCNPKLLIADEPTTALDVTIQAQILELMKELQDRTGMAILLITHDFGVVGTMADDIATMYAGRIVERGAAEDVFANPQHPYTAALLRAIPVLGMTRDRPLEVIPGTVPTASRWPSGCRFASRCPHVFAKCRVEDPGMMPAGRQEAACWLADLSAREVVAGEGGRR
jgi:oligopeptide/dipeptide ABC transporter ATP-binding protein